MIEARVGNVTVACWVQFMSPKCNDMINPPAPRKYKATAMQTGEEPRKYATQPSCLQGEEVTD